MNNNGNHGSGFFNGFLMGLIIGGGLVFLLGTKKGKKIVKVISEGLEDVSEITDLLEEDELEKEYQGKPQKKMPVVEDKNYTNGELKEETQLSPTFSPKRFFRGIPKKS